MGYSSARPGKHSLKPMALYRHKGRLTWTMDFIVQGQRIHETTGTRSKALASKIEAKRRRELEEGIAGIRKAERPMLFKNAAAMYLELKAPRWSPRTLEFEEANLKHLLPAFGGKLVVDIDAADVVQYQKTRLAKGLSPRTVNMEVGTFRAIMSRSRNWARIMPDVKMLKTRRDVGQALTPGQYDMVVEACNRSQSRMLAPFVQIAMETGARTGVIKTLTWGNVDFVHRRLTWGKDKTDSGTGRTIPLSHRAFLVLELWAESFPGREPNHYVFPQERYGSKGDRLQNSQSITYATDPTKSMGSIKTAWNGVRKKLGFTHRLHDLRHTAVSRMTDEGVPLPTIAKIVGWSPSTMAQMLGRYAHPEMDKMREAVNSITGRRGSKDS
jgi:integrase